MGICLRWLLSFVAELYEALPDDLNLRLPQSATGQVKRLRRQAEADEIGSFVGRKANQPWRWLAIDVESKPVIAFYVGDRRRKSARKRWERIPLIYRRQATFDTEDWEAYKGVMPKAQPQVCAKGSGKSNIIERCNRALQLYIAAAGVTRGAPDAVGFKEPNESPWCDQVLHLS